MLEAYLQHFCLYNQCNWPAIPTNAKITYKSTLVESSRSSPWEHLYGFNPRVVQVVLGSVAGPAPMAKAAAELYVEWVALLTAL